MDRDGLCRPPKRCAFWWTKGSWPTRSVSIFSTLASTTNLTWSITAGHVILGAIAGRTKRIKLGTSVLVLSTRDPVRVFHDFSTLNAVAGGRAELVVGRASQTESFPLFGFDLADYDSLFAEKLDLLVKLLREPRVTWAGQSRADLDGVALMPTLEKPLTTWIGIGGNPQSVVRAGELRFAAHDCHHRRGSPALFAPHYSVRKSPRAGRATPTAGGSPLSGPDRQDRRGSDGPVWTPLAGGLLCAFGGSGLPRSPEGAIRQFEAEVAEGSLFVGSPETVAQKLAKVIRDLRLSRFDLKYDLLHMPVEQRAESIRLFGREVAPRVRELLGSS